MLDLTCPGEEWRVEISLMRMFMMVAKIKIIRSRRWRGEGRGGGRHLYLKEVPPIWKLHWVRFRRVNIWANYLSLPKGKLENLKAPPYMFQGQAS